MKTNIETLWLCALASKCRAFNEETFAWPILIVILAWLAMTSLYWAHPGGHAWGRYWRKRNRTAALPHIPGPKGLPLLGSMSLMTNLAHRKIASVAEACKATRLMAFSLGETRVIVTCNPAIAKEILNSSVFADRPIKESAYSLMFNRAIGFAPYGFYWRTLRKIAATNLFCPRQIKASEPQRHEIAAQMVNIFSDKSCSRPFVVREVLKRASFNHMMCSVFGRKYKINEENCEVEELKKLVDEGYDLLGVLNWSDHLPWLSEFDPQKIRLRCSKLVPKVNSFVGRIIAEHRAQNRAEPQDFADVLLSLQGSDKLSDSDMIAVLWEMIFRGTDTVAVLIEWIIARMVLHPHIQSKVQQELDTIVMGTSRPVSESDLASMTYLPAVVKEALRLHPPGPLLSWARLATTDTTIDGHHIPKGTTAMVNMWAICRDPHVWQDPQEFMPERFEGPNDVPIFGSDLRLAPFGSGRRVCPGKMLGYNTVCFWVATLLHEFEWMPSNGKNVDLSEVLKLSCEMASPLEVMVRPRRMRS